MSHSSIYRSIKSNFNAVRRLNAGARVTIITPTPSNSFLLLNKFSILDAGGNSAQRSLKIKKNLTSSPPERICLLQKLLSA